MSFYTAGNNGSDRDPCPICGHPTGDCAGDLSPPTSILLHGTTSSLEETQTVYVEEDIYGERKISEYSTARFLIARKGSSISFKKARELGII